MPSIDLGKVVADEPTTESVLALLGDPSANFESHPLTGGVENLLPWYGKLKTTGGTGLKLLLSGDSITRSGVDDFDKHLVAYLADQGFYPSVLNRGNSNHRFDGPDPLYSYIDSGNLASEIAEAPDLMVICYGVNDIGQSDNVPPETALLDARAAMTAIRASRSFDQTSIILCGPTSYTSTFATLADQRNFNHGLYLLAVEFRCAFTDRRSLFPDKAAYTPVPDVHPFPNFSYLSVANLAPLVCPRTLRYFRPIADKSIPLVEWNFSDWSSGALASIGSNSLSINPTNCTTEAASAGFPAQVVFNGTTSYADVASFPVFNRCHNGSAWSMVLEGEDLGNSSWTHGDVILGSGSTASTSPGIQIAYGVLIGVPSIRLLKFSTYVDEIAIPITGTVIKIEIVCSGSFTMMTVYFNNNTRLTGFIKWTAVAGDSVYYMNLGQDVVYAGRPPMKISKLELWDHVVNF